MTVPDKPPLYDAVTRFTDACARNYIDLLADEVPIPLPQELALVQAIGQPGSCTPEVVEAVRARVDKKQAYNLGAFARRMAVYAVRTGTLTPLRAGVFGLVLDQDIVDYRDTLYGLALIEDCARRLGADFPAIITPVAELASPERRELILNGWLARQPKMRAPVVMGFVASGSGSQFTYTYIPFA